MEHGQAPLSEVRNLESAIQRLYSLLLACVYVTKKKKNVEYYNTGHLIHIFVLRFRGRLVGGFPPSPALIILPSIKAPQELTAENKKKRGHVYTHT